jgi:hypothetical protein
LEKDEKEKLEEIIRLLRKFLSKDDYNPRVSHRASKHNLPVARGGGGYKSKSYFPQHYQAYQGSGLKSEAKRYETKEKASSYSAKTWNEPMQYQPRERIVYDPEVKRILKSIEQKLGSDPEAEEILRQLENNPELYEKVVEKLSKDLERPEANEPDFGEGAEKEGEYKADEQSLKEAGEPIEPINQESSQEIEQSIDEVVQKDAEVEAETEKESLESSSEAEISTEPVQEAKPSEEIEPQVEELSSGVIEKIEAQDLSSLEAELYQEPLEPIELIEPEVDPMQPSEPLEQKN